MSQETSRRGKGGRKRERQRERDRARERQREVWAKLPPVSMQLRADRE